MVRLFLNCGTTELPSCRTCQLTRILAELKAKPCRRCDFPSPHFRSPPYIRMREPGNDPDVSRQAVQEVEKR